MIKMIHPKTGIVRDVAEANPNKINLLKRAGFVDLEGYKPPKRKEVVPDPTVAEIVKKNKEEALDPGDAPQAESAIHVSGPARGLIKKFDIDPALIEGTGRNGQITKPDVKKYLKALEEEEVPPRPEPEVPPEAPPEPENPAAGDPPVDEPVVRDATEEEEAAEKILSAEDILTHDDPAPETSDPPKPIEKEGPDPPAGPGPFTPDGSEE